MVLLLIITLFHESEANVSSRAVAGYLLPGNTQVMLGKEEDVSAGLTVSMA